MMLDKLLLMVACTLLLQLCPAHNAEVSARLLPSRPSYATEATGPLYYFGVGSNMLRSKVESRGLNGSKIEVISMQPAVVCNHRLAFNMRAFPPLEPAMGGIEPSEGTDCHG